MKKKLPIVVAVVLVLAIVVYFVFGKQGAPSIPGLSDSESSDEETSFTGSIKDLLSGGKAQKCVYVGDEGEGTVYVTSDSKVRADFTSTSNGKTQISHTIIDGDISYIWTDEETTGIKMTIDTSEPSENQETTSDSDKGTQSNEMSTQNDYKCSVWLVDSSKFDLPDGVTFQSMDDLYKSFSPSNLPVPTSE